MACSARGLFEQTGLRQVLSPDSEHTAADPHSGGQSESVHTSKAAYMQAPSCLQTQVTGLHTLNWSHSIAAESLKTFKHASAYKSEDENF